MANPFDQNDSFGKSHTSEETNPFASPLAVSDAIRDDYQGTDAEWIRQQHIKHEASIKSIGLLYYLGTALTGIGGLFMLIFLANDQSVSPGERPIILVLGVVYLAIAALSFFAARGIRSFQKWGRPLATILAVLSLLNLPIGTLIGGYTLYLIWSEKGNFIFSDAYPPIVAATPHVKYKTSIVVWIFLGLLVIALVALIAAAMFAES